MPQGKGTYGRQVGRPSKKNKYQLFSADMLLPHAAIVTAFT